MERRSAVAEGVAFARDLVNEPANALGPVEFAEQLKGLAKLGVEVKVLGEADLRKQKMGALLGVVARLRAPAARRRHALAGRARQSASRSPSSARASSSTPAASRSSRPPAWRT